MWIDTDEGWINLDFVERVVSSDREDRPFLLLGRQGKPLGHASEFPSQTRGPVVPAAAGQTGTVLARIWRPNGSYVIEATERAIAAWALTEEGTEPIFAGEAPDEADMVLLRLPSGTYEEAYSGQFATLDDAKAEYVNRLQRRDGK